MKKKIKKRHMWVREDFNKRRIDEFAARGLGSEYHNGPKCVKCGFEFCKHCNPKGWKTECGTPSIEPKSFSSSPLYQMYKNIIPNL